MPYYVYVILCKDKSFYTGYTKDLDSRMRLHMNGKASRYTRMHRPKKIVYVEEFGSRAEAMRREKNVKRLNHRQKLKLINSRNKPKIKLR
jgi:putative endonuclease